MAVNHMPGATTLAELARDAKGHVRCVGLRHSQGLDHIE